MLIPLSLSLCRIGFGPAPTGGCSPWPPAKSSLTAYLKVFHEARAAAFSEAEAASLIAHRPYDLRDAAVSTWLNAGVAPAQVAKWAGHTVDVLLRACAGSASPDSRTNPSGESSKPTSQPETRPTPNTTASRSCEDSDWTACAVPKLIHSR